MEGLLKGIPTWLEYFAKEGIRFERLMVSTAFGDRDSGRIEHTAALQVISRVMATINALGSGVEEITLADTTGYGNPESVKRLVGGVYEAWPGVKVGLHLHDTRGTGMANVYAGLEMGVNHFDCSVGGMGGCPFTSGAAGNVPTEDVAFMCEELGIQTGLDLEKYIQAARLAEQIIGRKLPGKLKDSGLIEYTPHT